MHSGTKGTPLQDERDSGPESPEALFISALLENGEFLPSKRGVTERDLSCFKPLFRFCTDHQDRVGRAPAVSLVLRRFPDFEFTPNVDPGWAAAQLRRAAWSRTVRSTLGEATQLLNDDDTENAYSALSALPPPMGTRRPGVEGFDATYLEEDIANTVLPVPWDALGRVSGGIAWHDLWYIGARTGVGKTNTATKYAARAVQDGWTVAYWSLEMPADVINTKIRNVLAWRDAKLQHALAAESKEGKKRALDELAEQVPGTFRTFDPSHGACTVEAVRDTQSEADLVIVDHVGLMTTTDGRRAIDDWRVAALISNRLKEEALRNGPPILGMLQVNRQGDHVSPIRCPRLTELADTDAFGRDGDVVITMNRYTESALVHETQKVRNGPYARWFTTYDPKNGVFKQITREQADVLAAQDEDRRSGY